MANERKVSKLLETLPDRPARILKELHKADGKTVTIERLIRAIWGRSEKPWTADNQVRRHILALRQEGLDIEVARNEGYRLQ